MHLKSYAIDGRLLRTGLANWSPTALKRQDNDVPYESSPEVAEEFEGEVRRNVEQGRELDGHGSKSLILSFLKIAGCG